MTKALEILNQQLRDETLWLDSHEEAIKELEEAMKPKTCEGCRHSDTCDILHSLYLNMLKIQGYAMNKNEFGCNKHQPKDNA